MSHTFKAKDFFLRSAVALRVANKQEHARIKKKLLLAKEIEDDLFYLKESAKKLLRQKKLKEKTYYSLIKRISKIKIDLSNTKKSLTSLLT